MRWSLPPYTRVTLQGVLFLETILQSVTLVGIDLGIGDGIVDSQEGGNFLPARV